MNWPYWLDFKEPYQNEKGEWVCPYCKETFPTKEDAYPRLIMTLGSYQRLYREYPDLRTFLEEQWRSSDGHPCPQFTRYFWKRYNERWKDIEIKSRLSEESQSTEEIEKKEGIINDALETVRRISPVERKPMHSPTTKIEKKKGNRKYEKRKAEKKVEEGKVVYESAGISKAVIAIAVALAAVVGFVILNNELHISDKILKYYSVLNKNKSVAKIEHKMDIEDVKIYPSENIEEQYSENDKYPECDEYGENSNYPHIIPACNYKGHISIVRFFLLGDRWYSIKLNISKSIYYGAKNGFKSYRYYCIGDACIEEKDWETKYYKAFIFDPHQKDIFKAIIRQLDLYSWRDENRFVELATSFVQNIPYDYDKYYNKSGNTRFPVEVLVDNKGVCGEKSLLLAGILAYAGYDVVLFEFKKENHMAVGIKCPCKNTFRGTGYCYIESTSLTPIGYVPEEFIGGIKLRSKPKIIKVSDGTKMYTNCKYIDYPPTYYKNEIIEKVRNYLESNYDLVYEEELTRSIGKKYLPPGYTSGTTWRIPIKGGHPDFILANFIKCHVKGKCDKNRSKGLDESLSRYHYFGVDIIEEGGKYYLTLLLAN